MSLFIFNDAINFRDTVAEIDALTVADRDDYFVGDLFGTTIFTESTYNDFAGESGQTLTVVSNFLLGTTVFTVTDASANTICQFSMVGFLDVEGGHGLEAAIASITGTEPDYISDAPGTVIEGFGTRDEMIGQGIFLGGGGGDKIELEDLDGGLGATSGNAALGGAGDDILKCAVSQADMRGQGGDDTLVLEFGRARMVGGTGADEFIFDNGYWDATGGSQDQADATARAAVTDFDSGIDELVFASVDPTMSPGDAPERQSLENLFGVGDLSTLADFTVDGVTMRFRETAGGEAVIIRNGTDSDGNSYNERVLVRGHGLEDIDRGDVFLQDYDADTYEFF